MKNFDQTIDIVIATYNSNGLIAQQLDSILNQSYKNLRVLIRDDGSTDDTISIIEKYEKKDSRVKLIKDNRKADGVGENFKSLLLNCDSDYVFLSDQDDVWYINKVENLLSFAIGQMDSKIPCIAYAPGRVVDNNLESLNVLTNYCNKASHLEDMLLTNGGIQGCAMVINKALYLKARECNFRWYMHDQVLTALAVCFGKTYFLETPLFDYRQHSHNVLGYNSNSIITKMKKYLGLNRGTFCINKQSLIFFENFNDLYHASLPKNKANLLNDFLSVCYQGKPKQIKFILNNNIRHQKSMAKSVLKCLVSNNFVER